MRADLENTFNFIHVLTYGNLKWVMKHKVGVLVNPNSELFYARMELLNVQVCCLDELNSKLLFKFSIKCK